MIQWTLKKLIGTKNERELKKAWPKVARINELEPKMRALKDEEFPAHTKRLRQEAQNGKPLDELLFEAFALVREAARRTIGQRHFDVQLIGGMFLHQGCIAEMRTGEGKTLTATLPSYLNSLAGRGVHIVTVNDYLARRDAEWMGRIHHFLGATVGCIVHDLSDQERQEAYGADITYGQNNEFGFDYLRDNMKFRLQDYVQRELHYAIVDEVDSILIDEARTPLIISGPSEESTDKYYKINKVIPGLIRDRDYTVDEKARSVVLTDEGVEKVEAKLAVPNLYDPEQIETLHHVEQGLRAHTLYRKDHEYVVKDGEVIIVDDFTGRLMPGRRWSDGLHQAVEAKENVKIENENQTLATAKESGDGKFAPVTAAEVDAELSRVHGEWKQRYDAALSRYRAECSAEHDEVVGVGGLHILGTERHESRRIDNQLRGRGGRQGDPGSSKFYLSLEDDLMRIVASDRISKLMETFGVQENEPI